MTCDNHTFSTDQPKPKLKRLKRGHKEEREKAGPLALGDMFDSDEEDDASPTFDSRQKGNRTAPRGVEDEFADFIEEDFPEDEGYEQEADDAEVTRRARRGFNAVKGTADLDETAIEDMKEAFGDGFEYDWALELQEQEDQDSRVDEEGREGLHKAIELKDVFEPSQLAERLLTDADNEIRAVDEPERFQLARKPYRHLTLTDEQFKEESEWISNLLMPKKGLPHDLAEPFQKSIAKVLEFMNTDEYEVPFIFQHRKDYLIHAAKIPITPDPNNPSAPEFEVRAQKLLNQSDLWEIFDFDLKFRAFVDKRNALQRTYDNLVDLASIKDNVFEEMLPFAVTMEELQDVQDYLYFQHSSPIADLAVVNSAGPNGTQRRAGSSRAMFEKIRNGKVYNLVRAYGITADAFAENALKKQARRQYTEDPSERPEDMALSEDVLDPPEYATADQCQRAARAMFAEEISLSPKMRKLVRQAYYTGAGIIDCHRTEKGLRKIDEQHPYYDFKYLRNQELGDIARRPDLFLRMLKAEEEGLVQVTVRLQHAEEFKKKLFAHLGSDNFSEVADAWNVERREALNMAVGKLEKLMARGVKENMKMECENQIARICREEYSRKLDQAPYKPKGMQLGTVPRVLALSNGTGQFGRDAICWAWVEEDGRVLENGKFTDLFAAPPDTSEEAMNGHHEDKDGVDVKAFVELVRRRNPDVIAVSGFSAESRKLYKQIEQLVEFKDLRGGEYEDDDGREVSDRLEVVIVNDEVARLYQTSERAVMEYPGLAPLTRYCVALAKYMQNPMKEYAALGKDIVSITFDPSQGYVPTDKILKHLDSAMVDMVNLCGIDINEAVSEQYSANLLPYISGLGPRKAGQLLKAINLNGGLVSSRAELVGDSDQKKLPAVGPRVWNNCASFLWMEFDLNEPESDYLDNTRVHPEDYELGRKMAADALELDEEDIQAEVQENGPGAVVRKLVRDGAQEKVNDLILEEYAEQLEKNFNQRKRATLETIRAELQSPYEELRRNFEALSTREIFTMFTGETEESICEGMVVTMVIKRVSDDSIDGKLDCGIDATVSLDEISTSMDVSPKQLYSSHQTVQGKILRLDPKYLTASLTLIDDKVRKPYRRPIDRMDDEWDDAQERKDKEMMQVKNDVSGRAQRVVKHPLFRAFNSTQAEEFLGSQARGDVVIRPSSKGLDHLAVTWKVSDNVFQHIDVLELDKENEFSLGRMLKIGRFTYSDLDELIVNHVQGMARKVDEMMLHEKYQSGSKSDTGESFPALHTVDLSCPLARALSCLPFAFSMCLRTFILIGIPCSPERWLETYTKANPKRSAYAFCINAKQPGYFYLCFKAGEHAKLQDWLVKVIPGAYELQKIQYQDMRALCNGFKLLFTNMLQLRKR